MRAETWKVFLSSINERYTNWRLREKKTFRRISTAEKQKKNLQPHNSM